MTEYPTLHRRQRQSESALSDLSSGVPPAGGHSVKCNRCNFRTDDGDLASEHARDAGHPICFVCQRTSLGTNDPQVCPGCVVRVRDDLRGIAIAYAHLERVISQAAYRGINWNALTLAADGSMESPQRPNQYTQPRDPQPTVHVEHRELVGDEVTLAAYVEQRVPSDGREHVLDHWEKDPLSVLAFLERHERDWRHEFGAEPAVDIATVAGCLTYLRTRHELAARTHPGFDDYAAEVRELRVRLEHVVGLADDAEPAAPCFVCNGRLTREFTDTGLSDDRTCRRCGATYEPKDYWFALRVRTQLDGWVPAEEAAAKVDRPLATIRAWVQAGYVPIACNWFTRRTVIEMESVQTRSDEVPRVTRKTA